MKQRLCTIFLVLALLLTGCSMGENQYVRQVKESTNPQYPGKTYGEAFDSFFRAPAWKHFLSAQQTGGGERHIVEFTGRCIYQDREVQALIQFASEDGGATFAPSVLAIDGVPQSQQYLDAVIEKIFTGKSSMTGMFSAAKPSSEPGKTESAEDENTEEETGEEPSVTPESTPYAEDLITSADTIGAVIARLGDGYTLKNHEGRGVLSYPNGLDFVYDGTGSATGQEPLRRIMVRSGGRVNEHIGADMSYAEILAGAEAMDGVDEIRESDGSIAIFTPEADYFFRWYGNTGSRAPDEIEIYPLDPNVPDSPYTTYEGDFDTVWSGHGDACPVTSMAPVQTGIDTYRVTIHSNAGLDWVMTAVYDHSTRRFMYSDAVKTGEGSYTGGSGYFYKDGIYLYWVDEEEHIADGVAFIWGQ